MDRSGVPLNPSVNQVNEEAAYQLMASSTYVVMDRSSVPLNPSVNQVIEEEEAADQPMASSTNRNKDLKPRKTSKKPRKALNIFSRLGKNVARKLNSTKADKGTENATDTVADENAYMDNGDQVNGEDAYEPMSFSSNSTNKA
ncbi:hypothetical protein MHBO_005006 [Bonamia ostreae]|uniref:Uncharacterized protein n=1 Tax=Bonamia ostreae TaxID=126728 RepID=A0ABV2AUU2_9EUKA